nr:reverse transcriptase domain-containing protein [Tanacetum cinerariifolium]
MSIQKNHERILVAQKAANDFVKNQFYNLKTKVKQGQKNHQAAIQDLEMKFGRICDHQSSRPMGTLPSNTQTNPKPSTSNDKPYRPSPAQNEHVNSVFTRSGKTYDPPVNPTAKPAIFLDDSKDEADEVEKEAEPLPKKPTHFLDMIKEVRINVPLVDVLVGMPNCGKFLKDLVSNKSKMDQISTAFLTEECSPILQNKLPLNLGDPRSFLIPCKLAKSVKYLALANLGASINLMLYSLYAILSRTALKPTRVSIRLANHTYQYPMGVAENMLVQVGKFVFPIDFVILQMEEDYRVPLILERPFLHTADAIIRVKNKELNLGIGEDRATFRINKAMMACLYRLSYVERSHPKGPFSSTLHGSNAGKISGKQFDIEIKNKKGAKNIAADHLSRLEKPNLKELREEEINDESPNEFLMSISTDEKQSPWFANFSNYLLRGILRKLLTYAQRLSTDNLSKQFFRFRPNSNPQYPEIHLSSQETSDKVFQANHSVQNEESSNEITILNSNQEKEEPPQDSDICQLIREECSTEVSEEQKQKPEHLLSMGYEHLSITPETESDEVTESNTENLLPIPSECEVALEDKRECDVPISENSPVCDNHSDIFFDSKIDDDISVYDDDFEDVEYVEASLPNPEIVSVEEENVVQQEEEEVDFEDISQIQDIVLREKLLSITRLIYNIESLNDSPTPDHERLINHVENDILDDSTNDPLLEEADLFLAADHSIPLGIENFYDSEGDIRFLEALLIDDSILSHESSDFNFEDNLSIPRHPPEPPDTLKLMQEKRF